MKYKKWTFEKLQEEALKYKTRGEFQKNSLSAYGTALKRKILNKICSHMANVYHYWTNKKLAQEAKKYKTRGEFQNKSPNAYQTAYKRKILDKICSHMEYAHHYWTNKELAEEAKKYKTRTEFARSSPAAYDAARRRKILDKICSHMGERLNKECTNKELAQEAKKYKTRGEFQKNSGGAYRTAQNRKILDKICSHMKTLGGTSKPEIELRGIIKSIYPKAHTFRKRSKKKEILIKGKPHIKGFEIDIYIPELRKGIEFDGDYHHSFGFMRKDPKKAKWSNKDIKNYHQIKDTWFLTKGIKILHIKEKDWKKDKQACIDKCFAFLK
jgi:hypothetical protein